MVQLLILVAIVLLFSISPEAAARAGPRAFLIALGLVALVSAVFEYKGRRIVQQMKDEAARKAADLSTGRGPESNFVLYLRPFVLDVQVERPTAGVFSLWPKPIDYEASIESFVERGVTAALPNAQLIAVKGSDGFLGPGQVSLDQTAWKREVAQLSSRARAIVFVLGASEGARWELKHVVRSGHLGKTVFILPPFDIFQKSWGWGRARSYFTTIAVAFAQNGLALPEPAAGGKAFVVCDELNQEWEMARNVGVFHAALRSLRVSM